jgi:hypothetical protein
METVRTINDYTYMYGVAADTSACVSAFSSMQENYVLIACEGFKLGSKENLFQEKCKALFYIGKTGADILFECRSHIPLVMQAETIEEAIMLASQFKVGDVHKIVFLPCVEKCGSESNEELIEKYKNTVNAL